jgi:hypothetical protein
MSKSDHHVNQAVHRLCLNQTVNRYYLLHVVAITMTMICTSSNMSHSILKYVASGCHIRVKVCLYLGVMLARVLAMNLDAFLD